MFNVRAGVCVYMRLCVRTHVARDMRTRDSVVVIVCELVYVKCVWAVAYACCCRALPIFERGTRTSTATRSPHTARVHYSCIEIILHMFIFCASATRVRARRPQGVYMCYGGGEYVVGGAVYVLCAWGVLRETVWSSSVCSARDGMFSIVYDASYMFISVLRAYVHKNTHSPTFHCVALGVASSGGKRQRVRSEARERISSAPETE